MNNGNFTPEGEIKIRRLEKKPVFPIFILILGIMGVFNPSWAVTAIVCGAIDKHLSKRWDVKSKIGTILGAAILALHVLLVVINLIAFAVNPGYTSAIVEDLKFLAELTKNMGSSGFLY